MRICAGPDCERVLVSSRIPAERRPTGTHAHGGGGMCGRCRWRALNPSATRQHSLDELMDEWVFVRGFVRWEDFGPLVGIKQSSWERSYERAKAAGDPRASRARCDESTWPDPAAGLSHVLGIRKGMSGAAKRREKQGATA